MSESFDFLKLAAERYSVNSVISLLIRLLLTRSFWLAFSPPLQLTAPAHFYHQ